MPAFLSRGFRPFFLGAAVLAMVSMAAWLAIYLFDRRYDATGMSPFLWHAHEMLFGYAMAVIGGFLLTAVWNWTGRKTAAGLPLAGLTARQGLGTGAPGRRVLVIGASGGVGHFAVQIAGAEGARVSAAVAMKVEDVLTRNGRMWIRLGSVRKARPSAAGFLHP